MGLHHQLLEAVRLEREALLSADIKRVQDATLSKEGLIEQIRAVEAERIKITTLLAVDWKKPLRELTLPNLIIELQGRDLKAAEQFRSVYNALTILIGRVRDQNDDNRRLVERSLEHINAMKRNVLGESAPKSNTYTQKGKRTQGSGNSRLISKEV